MEEEKLYIGSKLIKGMPLDECSFLKSKGEDVTNRETREGYRVTYPDGYVSWSPKDVFEIIPESENRFYCFINGLGKIHFNIVTNKNGKVIRAIREIGFRRLSFEKIR